MKQCLAQLHKVETLDELKIYLERCSVKVRVNKDELIIPNGQKAGLRYKENKRNPKRGILEVAGCASVNLQGFTAQPIDEGIQIRKLS